MSSLSNVKIREREPLSTAIKDLTCNFELINIHPLNALKSMNYQLSNGFGPSYAQNLGGFDNFEKNWVKRVSSFTFANSIVCGLNQTKSHIDKLPFHSSPLV